MYCPKCGKLNNAQTQFCSSCGTQLPPPAADPGNATRVNRGQLAPGAAPSGADNHDSAWQRTVGKLIHGFLDLLMALRWPWISR